MNNNSRYNNPLLLYNNNLFMNNLENMQNITINHLLDTSGLICPEPVMLLHQAIRKADGGDIIQVIATDPATTRDIPNFCQHLGHELLAEQTNGESEQNLQYLYWIQKK